MKTRFIKSLLAMVLTLVALPMLGQDYMNVYFKDGKLRTFHLDNVKEFKISKVDADGVMHFDYDYQHIETLWEKHVYALSDVDSITFTKYNPQIAKESTVSAMTSVMPILEDCYTITDVSKKMDDIKQAQSVETAWVEGDVLFVKIKDWQTVKFYFDQYLDTDTLNISSLVNYTKTDASSRQINNANGEKLKAIVANQQHFDNSWSRIKQREQFMYPLRDKFVNAGYRAKYDSIPNLDFFLDEMYDYDIVFLSTHGGYSAEEGHSFVSGRKLAECLKDAELEVRRQTSSEASAAFESVFEDERFANSRDHLSIGWVHETKTVNGITGTYIVGYVDINESFFSNIVTREFTNPKSLMFNAACHSMQDGYELGDILRRDRKLGTYLGYTQSNYFGQEAGCTMLMNMLDGISAEKAYEDLGSHPLNALGKLYDDSSQDHITGTYKDEDIARIDLSGNTLNQYFANLILYPKNNAQRLKRFITPVFTSEIDHDEAVEQYKTDHNVILWATTTTMDKDKLSMGFKYGTSKDNLNNDLAAEMVLKTLDTGKGNYRFTAKLKNVNNRQTYYFCAYTSDGQYFNYGDTCDIFSEPADLELSAGSFCINEGKSTTIDITSGNGEYDIFNGNHKVTTVTLEGEKIKIDAIGAGESTIIVMDKKTGEEVKIEVTVWANLSIAIVGNIDLEVGASANVRIMSGNNDYTLDSDKPEKVKLSLVGEFITVEALSDGKATITVTDNKTGQTASFQVTITKGLVDFVLSMEEIKMNLLAGATFIISSGNGTYDVKSSNEEVATASLRGNYVDIDAKAAGIVTITVTDVLSNQHKAVYVTIVDNTPVPDTPAEAVDLGLPSGTLWASYNLGATYPEDYGRYFAWGETTTKAGFEWEGYEYYNSTDSWIFIGNDISGTEFDVASKLWGESWKMPTADQFKELKENCTVKETEVNGVYGRQFTGKNGNSIFLPAGGSFTDYENKYKGYYGYYWSSTLSSSYKGNAKILFFKKRGELMIIDDGRANGVSVRPVTIAEKPVADLVLEITEPISLKTGDSKEIKIISGSDTYSLESSDEAVATADISDWVSLETMEKGKSINVRAVGVGTATITVTDIHSGQRATLNVTVSKAIVVGEAINLGLPSGTLWASFNVGATKPEEYGNYYAFGETESKTVYNWETYKYSKGNTDECTNLGDISGTEYDAARAVWGNEWRMPTYAECEELISKCTSEWATEGGVEGRRITGPNGNSIFLPAGGAFDEGYADAQGKFGWYWTSTHDSGKDVKYARSIVFNKSILSTNGYVRSLGFLIRPVWAAGETYERDLMLSTEDGGTTYKIYRQIIDKNDVHTNPDNWKTYKSKLTLDVTKNGSTTTYLLDDNIYLEDKFGYNEGQKPCIILNHQTNEIGIFCVSKDAKASNYTMDGYYYRSPMNAISFQRESVFGNSNWGWFPYFTYNTSSGQLKLQHFSYKGYYAMTSTRSSSGSWSTKQGSYTKPDTFKQNSLQIGNVLVVGR